MKKQREFHRTIFDNYENETVWDREETRYRMLLYCYQQKIQQFEILLVHNGSIQTLKAILASLASSVKSVASPTQCSGQVSSQGTREMGQPSTAERDAAWADALAVVQYITQPPPPTSCATSGSISLIDSDEASVAGTQGGLSSTMVKRKQVDNIKPVPRSVSNTTQELRMMLPYEAHSPSQAGHITQIGVMVYPCHTSYHLLHLMVINPSWVRSFRDHWFKDRGSFNYPWNAQPWYC